MKDAFGVERSEISKGIGLAPLKKDAKALKTFVKKRPKTSAAIAGGAGSIGAAGAGLGYAAAGRKK